MTSESSVGSSVAGASVVAAEVLLLTLQVSTVCANRCRAPLVRETVTSSGGVGGGGVERVYRKWTQTQKVTQCHHGFQIRYVFSFNFKVRQ